MRNLFVPLVAALGLALGLSACNSLDNVKDTALPVAEGVLKGAAQFACSLNPEDVQRFVDNVNKKLAEEGSRARVLGFDCNGDVPQAVVEGTMAP